MDKQGKQPQSPSQSLPSTKLQSIVSDKSDIEPDYKSLYEKEKKKVAILEHQLELQKIKTRKLMSATNNKNKGKICPKCYLDNKDQMTGFNGNAKKEEVENVKEDMKGFSDKIGQLLKKNHDKSILSTSTMKKKQQEEHSILTSMDLQTFQSKHSTTSLLKQTSINPFPMVENFTIFGVSQQSIASFSKSDYQGKSDPLEGQLLYSFNEPSDVDKQAGKLVFPNGVGLKKLVGQRARDKGIQIMSYSYANLKSFILRFKCQDNVDEEEYEKNEFLCHINPAKSLFCLCIGISDYTTIDPNLLISPIKKNKDPISLKQFQSSEVSPKLVSPSEQKISTTSMTEEMKDKQFSSESIPSNGEIDKEKEKQKLQIYLSQRVFCVSSYYPFFNFYEEILRSLLNFVKMERLMIFKHQNENLAQADSKFHLQRMQSLFISSIRDLNSKTVSFNRSYQLKMLNHQKITLLTDWNLAKNFFIQEWIFPILNMFTVEIFIDLLTLMMLEDRIVFICNNSHILTYTVFLFTNILVKPFVYAFQVVSIIPEEDFLGAPFPVVYGMLRKRKDVENSRIMDDYKNTYVFLSPDKVDIVYTQPKKHILKYRPQKLKSDLTQLFKDLKRPRSQTQKPAKYELQTVDYPQTSSIEERETSVSIVQKVHEYMLQEVVNKIPNQYEIKNLKNSIDISSLPQERDQHTVLMEKIKELVRKNLKESFVERLLDTQMISNLVCK